METIRQKRKQHAMLLETQAVCVSGVRLEYRLEFANAYWITVDSGTETVRVFLGESLGPAWKFFELAVRNSVTPCTLEEIHSDFLYLQLGGE